MMSVSTKLRRLMQARNKVIQVANLWRRSDQHVAIEFAESSRLLAVECKHMGNCKGFRGEAMPRRIVHRQTPVRRGYKQLFQQACLQPLELASSVEESAVPHT
eukprot:3493518-Amphidinium_carterae.1